MAEYLIIMTYVVFDSLNCEIRSHKFDVGRRESAFLSLIILYECVYLPGDLLQMLQDKTALFK